MFTSGAYSVSVDVYTPLAKCNKSNMYLLHVVYVIPPRVYYVCPYIMGQGACFMFYNFY